jgi:hypothetical protein
MTDITVEDSATVDASDVADENPGESGLDAVDELLALPGGIHTRKVGDSSATSRRGGA